MATIIDTIVHFLSEVQAWQKLSCAAPGPKCPNQVMILTVWIVGEEHVALGAYCFEHRTVMRQLVGKEEREDAKEDTTKET